MQVLFQSCQLPNRLQTEWILFWSDASCPIQVGLWTDGAADTGIPAWVTLIAVCPDAKVLMRICFLFTVCMHGKVFQQEVTCRLISIASACLYCIKQKLWRTDIRSKWLEVVWCWAALDVTCQAEDYSDKPKTVVMQYIVLFSHFTVLLPSDALSQKHDAAVWRPAPALNRTFRAMPTGCSLTIQGWSAYAYNLPFFCIITVVTTYLKGLFRSANRLMQVSRHVEVHWPTCIGTKLSLQATW